MSLKIDVNRSAVAYHITDGATTFPYAVDAHHAVSAHPKEWSFTPWTKNGEKSEPIIEIPVDWQDLTPIQRINLAASLGETRKGLTASKADEAIQNEVDRREAAAD